MRELTMDAEGKFNPTLSLAFHSDGKKLSGEDYGHGAAYDGNIKYCNGIH